jgi:ArsR family transcriptional regulator
MGLSKTERFTDHHNGIATLARALGHPARIAIVEFLLSEEKCYCRDIFNELPLAQATISRHLKELRNAEVIRSNVEGRSVSYCVEENAIKQLHNYLSSLLPVTG